MIMFLYSELEGHLGYRGLAKREDSSATLVPYRTADKIDSMQNVDFVGTLVGCKTRTSSEH